MDTTSLFPDTGQLFFGPALLQGETVYNFLIEKVSAGRRWLATKENVALFLRESAKRCF